MSRFDELDHRLGRHDDKPHPDCPICDPALAVNAEKQVPRIPKFWDHEGPAAPAFPNFGDIWVHRGETLVFVTPDGGPSPKGGFWASPYTPIENAEKPLIDQILKGTPHMTIIGTQLEMGSGRYNSRVKTCGVTQRLPSETALSSPLGVDLPQWAQDKNRASLIVEMDRKKLFPVGEIVGTRWTDHDRDCVVIESSVRVIEIPPVVESYQMTMPF